MHARSSHTHEIDWRFPFSFLFITFHCSVRVVNVVAGDKVLGIRHIVHRQDWLRSVFIIYYYEF